MADGDLDALVTKLIDPIVILNAQNRVCFTNPLAEKMLGRGLKERLERHLATVQPRRPISQVRFPLDDKTELILKIRLADIEWAGEKATQVSLRDVTPYITAAREIERRLTDRSKHFEELTAQHAALQEHSREDLRRLARALAELETARARLAEATSERDKLRAEETPAGLPAVTEAPDSGALREELAEARRVA